VAANRAAILLVLAAGLPCAAGAQPCVPDTTPDWTTSTASSAPVRPADCAVVQQTPPDISWPDLSPDAQYQLRLTYPDGSFRSATIAHNWINWDAVLPAGNYTWQVQVTNAKGTWNSLARRFTVDTSAIPFVVPDWSILFQRATAKAHPRALPDAATFATMLQQRQVGLTLLLQGVNGHLADAVPPEPGAGSKDTIELATLSACTLALNAAFAWVATGNATYLDDALRRSLGLASWDPHGTTSYANVDQASRLIAWTLTLAYDWLWPSLDSTQRNQLLAATLARASDIYNDIIGSRARVAVQPYDSHGNQTLLQLAAISVLLAGDLVQAQDWLRRALPRAWRGVPDRVRLNLVPGHGAVWRLVCGRPLTSFLFGGLDPVEKTDAGSLVFRAAEWCFEPADQISLMPQAPADDRDRNCPLIVGAIDGRCARGAAVRAAGRRPGYRQGRG